MSFWAFIFTLASVFVLVILTVLIISDSIEKRRNKEVEAETKEQEKRNAELLEIKKKKDKEILDSYIEKYGTISKSIQYGRYSDCVIHVFESSSTIMIAGKPYRFEDIVSFDVIDNSTVIYSGRTANTETNTGSMIGRSIVGGIVGGGVGSIIGGATASKTTNISGQTAKTSHDYTINITVNDLSDPLIELSLYNDPEKALNKIVAILTIIVNRNNKNNV